MPGLYTALDPLTLPIRHFSHLLTGIEIDTNDEATRDAYQLMVRLVEKGYEIAKDPTTRHRYFEAFSVLMCIVPPLFSEELLRRRPRALAILAHFICLENIPSGDKAWWLSGCTMRKVECLFALVSPDWAWAFDWPLRVAKVENGLFGVDKLLGEPFRAQSCSQGICTS